MAGKLTARFWYGLYGFTALILTLAVVVFAWLASESRKEAGEGRTASAPAPPSGHVYEDRYRQLARFVPPAWDSKSGDRSGEFQPAMARYSAGDYTGAIAPLRAVVVKDSGSAEAHYYLGICLLAGNERDGAIRELRSTIALGASPYRDGARFYLAKGLLGAGDVKSARAELEQVIAADGDYRQLAQVLLSQIAAPR